MDPRCSECGTVGQRLNALGVCAYRSGCEHRQLRHEAEMGRLTAALALNDPLPCGHTQAEHGDLVALMRSLREGYTPDDTT